MNDSIKPLQVLLSEGSSTSAREAITILGLSGHRVEICDPSAWCLGRYSRFVRKISPLSGVARQCLMLSAIGTRLVWHGALSIDYLMPDDSSPPLLID